MRSLALERLAVRTLRNLGEVSERADRDRLDRQRAHRVRASDAHRHHDGEELPVAARAKHRRIELAAEA